MSVKISIGSAIYNVREPYLRQHIESIIKQLTDETELLLIDDCSTDNSGSICREYAAANSRVRYVNMGENGGLSRVRNRTVSESVGEWIFFADGDDVVSDNFVRTALDFCDDKYDIIIHNRQIFHQNKTVSENKCDVKKLTALPEEAGRNISISCLCMRPLDGDRYGMSKDAYYHAAWGALYKRSFLIDNRLQFPAGQKKAQDSVFNTYAYYCAKTIAYLPYTMYYYRKDMQGITQRYNPDFTKVAMSLIGHHNTCIEKLYPNDAEVADKYKNYRLIALAVDAMRLNFFHKNNPKRKAERKCEFTEFINTEPFKSAISDYCSDTAWWGWVIPVSLAARNRFTTLDFLIKHWHIFELYGKLYSLLRKVKSHL